MNVGDLVDAGHAEIKTGPFGTQLRASDYVLEGRPVLNVRNVGFGDVRPKGLEYVNEATASRLSSHLLKANDIVFGRKGAVDRHAFISDDYDGAMQGSDCIRLRLSDSSPLPARFITFAFRTKQHREWMQAFCSHGATMASLNQDIVRQIPLPEIDQAGQDLAVAVLQNIDDLIENNRRRVEVLEEMARAIYREWFVHFRYPGHETATFVDSPVGSIPSGWVSAPFEKIVSLERTSVQPARSPNELFDHYSIPAFDEGQLPAKEAGSAIRSNKYLVSAPAVLISKLNPRIERTWLVNPGDSRRSVASTEFLVLRPSGQPSLDWLYLMMRSEPFQTRIKALSGGTSTSHQRVKPNDLLAIDVAGPSPNVLKEFSAIVRPQMATARVLRAQGRKAEALRNALLPMLVTGQIDVSSFDLDALVENSVA